MTINFSRGAGAALVYLLASGAAMAEVSAQQVWDEWRGQMTGAGYQVSATESFSGGSLVLTDIEMSMSGGDPAMSMNMGIGRIELRENGDGTVAIILPATMPVSVEGEVDGDAFAVTLNYSQTGMDMTVSGTPEALSYDYTAQSFGIALASLMIEGEAIPPENAKAQVTLVNIVSSTQIDVGDLRGYTQNLSADLLSYDVAFSDPKGEGQANVAGEISGFGFDGSVAMPLQMDTVDMQKMLADGFAMDGTFNFSGGKADVNVDADGEQFAMTSSSTGGNFRVAMSSRNLTYEIGENGLSVSLQSNQLPFPVAFEMASIGFNLSMPLAKADEQQDFAMGFSLRDFTVSDMIWSIFDGGAVLPRDPATVVLDVTGKVRVLLDLMDPEATAAMENTGMPPGELDELSINEFEVSAVGASLTGTGAFTFDNNDLETFGGIPAPTGAVDLKLVGANALLDKIVQMGFISDQDAMGGRMMMGMLAVPGDGDDTLISKIEVNAQGQVMANGQRIK